jgi:hypothetical protein
VNRAASIFVALAFGAVAPAASAHPSPRSYWRTYPVASSLCSRVEAGQTPKRLAADTAQLNAACTALSNSYQQALSAYESAVAPIASQVESTLTSLAASRQAAAESHDWSSFASALRLARTTLKGLRAQERTAAQAYVSAVRAARRTFWTTVHALPGAGSLPSDSGNPAPPSAPSVPVLS